MRITSGKYGGHLLLSPKDSKITRPTSDKVRSAIFDILISRDLFFDGCVVADIFCGTGAFGIEAISRGASHTVFIDNNQSALSVCKSNLAKLRIPKENFTILKNDATKLKDLTPAIDRTTPSLRSNEMREVSFTSPQDRHCERRSLVAISSLNDKKIDLVFADPPYHKDMIIPCFNALFDANLISENCVFVAEISSRESPLDFAFCKKPLEIITDKKYGETRVFIMHCPSV